MTYLFYAGGLCYLQFPGLFSYTLFAGTIGRAIVGRYLGILGGFFLVLLLTGLGVWLTWPWVFAENYRFTTLQLCLSWSAEVAALLWFLYFAIRYAFTWELESAFGENFSGAAGGQWIALFVAVAFVVDLSSTFVFQSQDEKLRQLAVPGVCRITNAKVFSLREVRKGNSSELVFTAFSWCKLLNEDGEPVKDEAGRDTTVYFYGKWTRYPEDVRDNIRRLQFPADMEVVYDPKFPRRFWVPTSTGDRWDGWRFSQEVTIFALGFSLLVLIFNQVLLQTSLPLEICPMLGVMLRFLFAGMDMWANGQTALPPF